MKKYFILIPAIMLILSCGNGSDENQKKEASDGEMKTEKAMSMEEREMREMAERQKNEKPKSNPYKNAEISVRVFRNDTMKQETKYTGYGYDIFINGANYNRQPHKPGVPGINGFKSAEDAKKTGELVAYKIRNNIMPPSLTYEELDSLDVLK